MQGGIVKLGSVIPVTMVTAAQLQAALDAFIAADATFNAARSTRLAVSEVFQGEMEAVYSWLLGVSNMLACRFGTRWSAAWAQAGFINGSTGIPGRMEERLGLLLSLVKFFTANPGFEVPTMNQTAAFGTTLQTAVLGKQQVLTTAEVALETAGDVWATVEGTLVGVMRGLIKNLEGKLSKDDPRWLEFGLNLPGAKVTPGQPLNVSAHLDETGALVAQCDPLALAERFRWRMRIVGVEAEFALVASTTEPMAAIGGVAAGVTVELIVQGVNGKSQGVASAPVFFTMPLAKGAGFRDLSASDHAPDTSEGADGQRKGNGNGNGHGRHAVAVR